VEQNFIIMKWIREKQSSLLSVIASFSREVDEKIRGQIHELYIFINLRRVCSRANRILK